MEYDGALPSRDVPARSRFYQLLALGTAGIVFVGFGPTYYWKPVIDSPALSTVWVALHAAACSLWMLLLCVQAALVGRGRTDLHRRLGLVSLVLVPAIVVLGLYVAIDFIRHNHALLVVQRSQSHRFFLSGSLVGIVFFAALSGVALALRRRPGFHKRYIVLATLILISASFSRLPLIGPLGPPWTGLPMWTLLGFIAWHDIRTEGRLHTANRIGIPLILLYALLVIVMSVSPAFDAIAHALGA